MRCFFLPLVLKILEVILFSYDTKAMMNVNSAPNNIDFKMNIYGFIYRD